MSIVSRDCADSTRPSVAGFEFVLQQHMIDRPGGEEAGRGRGGQPEPEQRVPYRRDLDAPELIVDNVHGNFHHRSGNSLSEPDYAHRGGQA